MLGLDPEYARKMLTLFGMITAVTAVGMRFAVYEYRHEQRDKQIQIIERKLDGFAESIGELNSTTLSRAERDTYHTNEINRIRDELQDLR
jgi:hypothetical protein